MKPTRLERDIAIGAVLSLIAIALIGFLFRTTPLSEWMGFLSTPLNRCGYDIPPVPAQYGCLAGMYMVSSSELIVTSAAIALAAAATRRTLGSLWWPRLVAAAVGALIAAAVKLSTPYLILSLKNASNAQLAFEIAGLATVSLMGAAFGLAVALLSDGFAREHQHPH
jgi:hypothetical protein